MKSTSIRMPDELFDLLQTIAERNAITFSELVRIALIGRLAKCIGNVHILDAAAANDLKSAVLDLCNKTADMNKELQAIGNNYNQIARRLNASAAGKSYTAIKMQIEQEDAAADLIASPDLPNLYKKYVNAISEMQDAIEDIYKGVI